MSTKWPQLAVGDWISVGARRHGDAPALVAADGRRQSYAQTDDRVNRLATAMQAQGLGAGSRIGILATDSVAHVEIVLACFKSGAVFCDLNFRLRAPELANIIANAQPDALFVETRYLSLVDEVLPAGHSVAVLTIGDGHASVESMIASTGPVPEFTACAVGEDIVSIAFTSGTTGVPKGVLQSERMFRNIVYSGVREMRMQSGAFRYAGAPLFHISGIGSVMYALASGSAALILPQFDAESVLQWMQHGGLTDCTLIPTMISALLQLANVCESDYSGLRSILYGGAPMTPALLRRTIEVFGCELYNGFGAGTEAGGQTMLYPEDHVAALHGREQLLGSIGKPIMGVDLRLCDDDLRDVPAGQIGEIVTRSETVMSGYLGQDDLTARSIVDGWFRAGDLAYADTDGYLYLASRKADMIIRGGENVYPVEIESTLAEHPAVEEVAVIGVEDDFWGEIVAAVVSLRPGRHADAETLQQFCRDRLASYKVPALVAFFDELPKNQTGKLDKGAIALLVAASGAHAISNERTISS